jgi:D-arabinose 1-dehydrogenase-like Zn-dependent alcohol dehydrogenase
MKSTYQAVEVTGPGKFRITERELTSPHAGQVRIRVEACGVCHSDLATVEVQLPGIAIPRVPGHEVVGRIDALGPGVTDWEVGQRVGVGWFGGECRTCEPCRRGDFAQCLRLTTPGVTVDGGYAEVMIAEARAIVAIPDELSPVEAAPLLCAGVTTYNCLRDAGLRPGDLVGIQGIGGLGHLGVQFARRMGFRTVAIGRGADTATLARELGAHDYIDTVTEDAVATLQRMGGARAILATAPSGKAIGELVPGLGVRGKMLIVGVSADPLVLSSTMPLVFGARSMSGSLTGSAMDEADTLAFSVLANVRPMTETMPLAQAPKAFERMMSGAPRFRMVLVTGQ